MLPNLLRLGRFHPLHSKTTKLAVFPLSSLDRQQSLAKGRVQTARNQSSTAATMPPHNDIAAFHEALSSSKRILALCGAGLSASSGLPTFRGAGGYWRHHDAMQLATMEAFRTDPGLVWLFYAYRRHMALKAEPNAGHYALAALAKQLSSFRCVTQNVDNLSQRAGHPLEQIWTLHGSLFNIKCADDACTWMQHGNFDDPFCPELIEASQDAPPGETLPLLDPYHRVRHIEAEQLPKCPQCKEDLQRPGVVWFGEMIDNTMLYDINAWIRSEPVDMIIVVGTSAQVYPAAGYIQKARKSGARVVTVNIEAEDEDELAKLLPGDFAFGEDASTILPKLLEPLIGKQQANGQFEKS